MSLPKSYLTTPTNLAGILDAIKSAQAPPNFTLKFLETLGFSSSSDRLVIGVLQALGFLGSEKKPTDRYFRFLDQTQSDIVLAEGIREAYADLFQINKNAQELSKSDVINKFRTLSQGQLSDSVLEKMGMTFVELCKLADFESKRATDIPSIEVTKDESEATSPKDETTVARQKAAISTMQYHINLILPESRDPVVYDALFRSLKEHLL